MAATTAQLTEAQQNAVKDCYFAALAKGDEPPYPLKGTQPGIKLIADITGNLDFHGTLVILTTVGADGKATSASVIGASPEDARYLAAASMTLKYKSAMCQGQPCAMIYPMYFLIE